MLVGLFVDSLLLFRLTVIMLSLGIIFVVLSFVMCKYINILGNIGF